MVSFWPCSISPGRLPPSGHCNVFDFGAPRKGVTHRTARGFLHQDIPLFGRQVSDQLDFPPDLCDSKLSRSFDGDGVLSRPQIGLKGQLDLDVLQRNVQDSRCVPQRNHRSKAKTRYDQRERVGPQSISAQRRGFISDEGVDAADDDLTLFSTYTPHDHAVPEVPLIVGKLCHD